ncbi:MAG: hypothetical protein H5T69_12595 [Chloroflexi bacterium]|nr:hypothetical protein [Chloroflexota bacterium]
MPYGHVIEADGQRFVAFTQGLQRGMENPHFEVVGWQGTYTTLPDGYTAYTGTTTYKLMGKQVQVSRQYPLSTGSDTLDAMLGGGIDRGITTILGPTGIGKSTLATAIAMRHNGLFFSFAPQGPYEQQIGLIAKRFGWDITTADETLLRHDGNAQADVGRTQISLDVDPRILTADSFVSQGTINRQKIETFLQAHIMRAEDETQIPKLLVIDGVIDSHTERIIELYNMITPVMGNDFPVVACVTCTNANWYQDMRDIPASSPMTEGTSYMILGLLDTENPEYANRHLLRVMKARYAKPGARIYGPAKVEYAIGYPDRLQITRLSFEEIAKMGLNNESMP